MRSFVLIACLAAVPLPALGLFCPSKSSSRPNLKLGSLGASSGRQSSSFVVDVVKSAKPSLVRIDLFGPRGRKTGTGTGIVFDKSQGLIVTNAHVAGVSRQTTLTLVDGSTCTAELVGRSPDCDVAVLRAEPESWAKAADFVSQARLGAPGDIQVGEHAVALGYAGMASDFMTTVGIITSITSRGASMGRGSSRRRKEPLSDSKADNDDTKDLSETSEVDNEEDGIPVVLTDATLSFGNSGGPLLNEWGEVVAMNTAIEMRPSSIGVAIAIEKVSSVVKDVLKQREKASLAGPDARLAVYLYNDPMNKRARVEAALAKVFGWESAKSNEVMMTAHTQGRALCGDWPTNEATALQMALSEEDLLAELAPV
mmetsp:Transcript_5655/g.13133  ORF Transcript_5655/g.13133 Transcript_5655/m.13133 type:complete len:369 (-) Transcript_5655:59-1165(-)